MLLLIDVGNTNIVMGLCDGGNLVHSWRLGTKTARTSDEYGLQVDSILRHYNISIDDIDDIIIGSVVPSLQHTIKAMCTKYLNIDPMVIGEGTKSGIKIRYDDPKQVGADRIANAVAAANKYETPCILVDIGTAISFDVISEQGDYLGGAIAPGIGISTEALFLKTSKLPKVELERPRTSVGKNTEEAIQAGVVIGFIGLIDHIIMTILEEMGWSQEGTSILATGGFAKLISKHSQYIQDYDYNITLEGMRIIYDLTMKDRNER